MERITHYFCDAIAVNGYLWLLEANMNALFKFDIKTFKMEFVLSFPYESTVLGLYRFAAKDGNKLVCCPRNAKRIVVYDTDSNNMEAVDVDLDKYQGKGARMYGEGIVGNKVYLPRRGYSEIYQFDVQSDKLSILDIVSREKELGMNDYDWHGRVRKYKRDAEISQKP